MVAIISTSFWMSNDMMVSLCPKNSPYISCLCCLQFVHVASPNSVIFISGDEFKQSLLFKIRMYTVGKLAKLAFQHILIGGTTNQQQYNFLSPLKWHPCVLSKDFLREWMSPATLSPECLQMASVPKTYAPTKRLSTVQAWRRMTGFRMSSGMALLSMHIIHYLSFPLGLPFTSKRQRWYS